MFPFCNKGGQVGLEHPGIEGKQFLPLIVTSFNMIPSLEVDDNCCKLKSISKRIEWCTGEKISTDNWINLRIHLFQYFVPAIARKQFFREREHEYDTHPNILLPSTEK